MFSKIVVGIDLSKPSLAALEQVLPIGRRYGSHVVMVSAGRGRSFDDWLRGSVRESLRALSDAELTRRRDQLEQIRQTHVGQGVDISQVLSDGPAEKVLSELAAELGADLIAVGAGGERHQAFPLGSVASRLVRQAGCDVLVARPTDAAQIRRVLVPTDFSPTARRALERGIGLAEPGATITLLHCWDLPAGIAGFSAGDLVADIEADANNRLDQLASEVANESLTIEPMLRRGYAASVIREVARSADLVALGSHGRSGFSRLVLGSVAEKVIGHVGCSVYVAIGRADE